MQPINLLTIVHVLSRVDNLSGICYTTCFIF